MYVMREVCMPCVQWERYVVCTMGEAHRVSNGRGMLCELPKVGAGN